MTRAHDVRIVGGGHGLWLSKFNHDGNLAVRNDPVMQDRVQAGGYAWPLAKLALALLGAAGLAVAGAAGAYALAGAAPLAPPPPKAPGDDKGKDGQGEKGKDADPPQPPSPEPSTEDDKGKEKDDKGKDQDDKDKEKDDEDKDKDKDKDKDADPPQPSTVDDDTGKGGDKGKDGENGDKGKDGEKDKDKGGKGEPGTGKPVTTPAAGEPPPNKADVTPSGTVLIKLPGSKAPSPLAAEARIPDGTVVNVRAGKITVETSDGSEGTFSGGVFVVDTGRTLTELRLTGGNFGSCPGGRSTSGTTKPRKPIRRLWGKATGTFRTRGKYGAATVRGTWWLTEDRCEGTLVKVRSGTVFARDFAKKRTVVVRAGGSYLAAAP